MAAPNFYAAANDVAKIPVFSHTSGSSALVLAVDGTIFPAAPFRLTCITGSTYGLPGSEAFTIYAVSAVAQNTPQLTQCTLTVAVIENTIDRDYSGSDFAECRGTAGTVTDIQAAVLDLQPTVPTVIKTANYLALIGDYVRVDCSAGSVTITLPAGSAPNNGAAVIVDLIAVSGAFTCTVATQGSDRLYKAGGPSTLSLATANQTVLLQYYATDGVWLVPATNPGGGSGTVTTVSVVTANGFAGTVATATTTPAITLSTSITGLLKGNGTAISAASAGTDYVLPSVVTLASLVITESQVTSLTTDLATLTTAVAARLVAASNLSDLTNAGTARTNLGVAIGTNVEAWDADLDALAALTHAKGNTIVSTAGAWVNQAVGADGTVIIADSSQTNGLRWGLQTGLFVPTAVKTSSYTAAANDFVVVNATAGTVPITLPTAPADKAIIGVKLVAVSGAFTCTVTCGGSDVFNLAGGVTVATLTVTNQVIWLQYKSSSAIWYVIATDNSSGGYVAGTNVTITTAGGTRTIAATGGGGGASTGLVSAFAARNLIA